MENSNESRKQLKREIENRLAEFDAQKAEEEELLAPFEQITTRGAVLIDGHHAFLGALQDIDLFNEMIVECENGESSDSPLSKMLHHPEIENIWDTPDPIYVADFVSALVSEVSKSLPLWVVSKIFPSDKIPLSTFSIIRGSYEDHQKYIAVSDHCDVTIFDANLPEKSDVIRKLESRWNAFHKWGKTREKGEVAEWLDLVKSDKWRFWSDGRPRELPYGFKKKFLEVLASDASMGRFKRRLGTRKIWVNDKSGKLYQSEKGVDSRLVITGCDIASDPDIDWVCLITNDADYVPLVERLKERGKKVFLLGWGNPKHQSYDLKVAVGPENIVSRLELLNHPDLVQIMLDIDSQAKDLPEDVRTMIGLTKKNPAFFQLLSKCFLVGISKMVEDDMGSLLDPVKEFEDWKEKFDQSS